MEIPTTSNDFIKDFLNIFAVDTDAKDINSLETPNDVPFQFLVLSPVDKPVIDESKIKQAKRGMSFDFSYKLGKYDAAFTYNLDAKAGDLFVYDVSNGRKAMCLGIIMQEDDDGEVHIMNCSCVRLAIQRNNFNFCSLLDECKPMYCSNRNCSHIACSNCIDEDIEKTYECPFDCKNISYFNKSKKEMPKTLRIASTEEASSSSEYDVQKISDSEPESKTPSKKDKAAISKKKNKDKKRISSVSVTHPVIEKRKRAPKKTLDYNPDTVSCCYELSNGSACGETRESFANKNPGCKTMKWIRDKNDSTKFYCNKHGVIVRNYGSAGIKKRKELGIYVPSKPRKVLSDSESSDTESDSDSEPDSKNNKKRQKIEKKETDKQTKMINNKKKKEKHREPIVKKFILSLNPKNPKEPRADIIDLSQIEDEAKESEVSPSQTITSSQEETYKVLEILQNAIDAPSQSEKVAVTEAEDDSIFPIDVQEAMDIYKELDHFEDPEQLTASQIEVNNILKKIIEYGDQPSSQEQKGPETEFPKNDGSCNTAIDGTEEVQLVGIIECSEKTPKHMDSTDEHMQLHTLSEEKKEVQPIVIPYMPKTLLLTWEEHQVQVQSSEPITEDLVTQKRGCTETDEISELIINMDDLDSDFEVEEENEHNAEEPFTKPLTPKPVEFNIKPSKPKSSIKRKSELELITLDAKVYSSFPNERTKTIQIDYNKGYKKNKAIVQKQTKVTKKKKY